MRNPVKVVRRAVQVLCLLLFIWLFAQTRWQGADQHPVPHLFLRMDLLAAIATGLAPTPRPSLLFAPAVIVLVGTLVLGRVFCGWVCPLGTMIDIADFLFLRRRMKRHEHLSRPAWKYYVLGASLAAALFGTQLFWLADPIPLTMRSFALALYPLAAGARNLGLTAGSSWLRAAGLRWYPSATDPMQLLDVAAVVVAVAVLGLSVLARRYWCRSLCPLGALLGFFGRLALLRRRVEGCVGCRRCASHCKMGAVVAPAEEGDDYSQTRLAECIQCFDCLTCPREGISRFTFSPRVSGSLHGTGADRRAFVLSVGAGLVYAAGARAWGTQATAHDRLVRPPGAAERGRTGEPRGLDENRLRDLCLRCGACMKACITGGIQPAILEAGFDGLYNPVLVPRTGYCEQACTACGDVCPSGALVRFTVEEKRDIRIGLATVDESRCLSWARGKAYRLCLVCDEHCPYDAIRTIENRDGELAPRVDPAVCVGCGQCEYACPVGPRAAIQVRRAGSDDRG